MTMSDREDSPEMKRAWFNSLCRRIPRQFVHFLLVGVLNTLFGLGVYWLLVFAGLHYSLAVLLSTVLGILFNFKTYGILVFRNTSNRLFLNFFLVYTVVYFFGVGMIKLLLLAGLDKYSAGAAVTIPNALISYLLNKKFVFRQPGPGSGPLQGLNEKPGDGQGNFS